MYGTYEAHGIRFQFPKNWEINEQRSNNQLSITVSSPDSPDKLFWMLSLFYEIPSENELIETALEAFREEYDEIDIYPVEATVCDRESVARDLEFVCLELINSVSLRAFRTNRFSALILFQGTDHELKTTKEQLEKISLSLECVEDEIFSGEA